MNAGMPAEPPISPAWAMRAVMHPECGGWSVVKSLESLAGRPLEKQYFRVCHLEASREGWTGVARIALLSAPVTAPMLRLPFQTGAFAALAACGGRAWFGRGHGHCPAFPRRFRGGGLHDGRGGSPEFDTKRQRKPDGAGHVRIFRAASIAVWVIPPIMCSVMRRRRDHARWRSGNTPADGNPQNRKTAKKEIFPGVSPESKQGRVDGVARIARALLPTRRVSRPSPANAGRGRYANISRVVGRVPV